MIENQHQNYIITTNIRFIISYIKHYSSVKKKHYSSEFAASNAYKLYKSSFHILLLAFLTFIVSLAASEF